MPTSIKFVYGQDPKSQGFFWIESEQKRLEALSVRRNAPADFEAVYQGRPGQRAGVVFLESDLTNHYRPPFGLLLGPVQPEVKAFIANAQFMIQAWDTAFSTTSSSAWTVGVTGMLVPCTEYHCGEDPNILGPCDSHFDVLILNVRREKLDFAGLIPVMRAEARLWSPQEIVIEKKASGIDAIATLATSGLPIVPVVPRDSKRARALNTVGLKTAGSVQGWFRQRRVLTPDPSIYPIPWFDAWKMELRDFSGDDDTSSDQVDATVHLVTRAIILGSGAVLLPTDWRPERSEMPAISADLGTRNLIAQLEPEADPRAVLLASIGGLPDFSIDPYSGMCSRCSSFKNGVCDSKTSPHRGRSLTPFDSCEHFESPTDMTNSITTILPTGIVRV